ncbi:HD domain-containing protein [Niveibacterium sp.]|uniref:HD domain-containing protein n=1 Tax=Niveibacterium sp. TaxID=2017444 RepID=UPI0035AE7FCA
MLTKRFVSAVELAVKAHAGQVRKSTDIPYASHVLAVASLVLEQGGDEDQAIAGLLHDVLEDCGPEYAEPIREQFGERVLSIVEACTDGEPGGERGAGNWRARKEAYLAALSAKPEEALLVSACDKLHNARAIAADHDSVGAQVFLRFNAGQAGTVWYYRQLLAVFQARLPDLGVTRELAAAVARFAA